MDDNQNNQQPLPRRSMFDCAKPTLIGAESSIVRPTIAANKFKLKPNTIQMLAKLVPERHQGSLPNNTETNPKEQVHAITVKSMKGLVKPEKKDIEIPMILGRPFLAIARTIIDVGSGELVLSVGDENVTLQARDFVRVLSERDDTYHSVNVSNHAVQ
ncbi:uncharacterized protein [Gossypium hirsutum]|uniref:Uncharacterized protein n=1 Tax=Gossypium hirsutum TaxID=3635 RepID=A0A1U8LT84_GOSHI|nr:uncharacterized protein LOC107929648 [Gossypium hirsutum]